ncbi:MAG: sensor histidine kinase [Gemmatimonadota bacterium]
MLALALALVATTAESLSAQRRLMRTFGPAEGLSTPWVFALAQDSTRFLWIGTAGGLFRYDGVEMRRWAPETLDGWVVGVATSGDGRIVVRDEPGSVLAVTDEGVRPLRGPDDAAVDGVRSMAFDADGALWLARGEALWRQTASGRWAQAPVPLSEGDTLRLVRRDGPEGVVVTSDEAVWAVDGVRRPRRIARMTDVADVMRGPEGARYVLTGAGAVLRLASGATDTVLSRAPRGIALARRGTTIWVAYDRHLVALRPGRSPDVVGPEDGLESGGPLLVDHENSLWVGTFTGLSQFPEPGTRVWTEADGLPSNHTRYLARTGDTLWVTTWQGLGRLTREAGGGWTAATVEELTGRRVLHLDRTGTMWTGDATGLVEVRNGRVVRRHGAARPPTDVSPAADGGFWLVSGADLLRVRPEDGSGGRVRRIPLAADRAPVEVLEDPRGRLWTAGGERVCVARAGAVERGERRPWSCRRIDGLGEPSDLAALPSGAVLLSSERAGLFCHRDGRWRPLRDAERLGLESVVHLERSRDGGIWILGHGIARRVRETGGPCGRLETIERLSGWHGLPTVGGADLLEGDDGDLWITTARGLVHLPRTARGARMVAPRVVVREARVDGERIRAGGLAELPYRRNRLELRFAALSYRDPSLIRYSVRLSPDASWSSAGGAPQVRWADLPAGRYHAAVRAALDDGPWSPRPAGFAFRVRPPWYLQRWALMTFAVVAVAALAGAYRARTAFLVGLERQRTRIAMDLHDEMGSAVASIGILAGVLDGERIERGERREIAAAISETTQELSAALSDIVWSLDPEANSLQELSARLVEHGERLFSDDTIEFDCRLPTEWPTTPVAAPVRRHVLLIGLEALHNAARHAAPRNVILSLERVADGWRLAVQDDGRGLPRDVAAGTDTGRGLAGMRRRAREIGATIELASRPRGGTTVALEFSLRPRRARPHTRLFPWRPPSDERRADAT